MLNKFYGFYSTSSEDNLSACLSTYLLFLKVHYVHSYTTLNSFLWRQSKTLNKLLYLCEQLIVPTLPQHRYDMISKSNLDKWHFMVGNSVELNTWGPLRLHKNNVSVIGETFEVSKSKQKRDASLPSFNLRVQNIRSILMQISNNEQTSSEHRTPI